MIISVKEEKGALIAWVIEEGFIQIAPAVDEDDEEKVIPGSFRLTADIDVWMTVSSDDLDKLAHAILEFTAKKRAKEQKHD